MRSTAIAIVMALCGLACGSASPPGTPADTVTRFFAAVEAGDCTRIWAELGQSYRARLEQEGAGCDVLVEQIRTYPLETVLDTRVDGRNPEAQLVRTRLRGRENDVIIRVQAEDGQWKIMAL
jgi:hypothetical protein